MVCVCVVEGDERGRPSFIILLRISDILAYLQKLRNNSQPLSDQVMVLDDTWLFPFPFLASSLPQLSPLDLNHFSEEPI